MKKKFILFFVVAISCINIQIFCLSPNASIGKEIAMLREEVNAAKTSNDQDKIESLNRMISYFKAKATQELKKAESHAIKYQAKLEACESQRDLKKLQEYKDKAEAWSELLISLEMLNSELQPDSL